MSHYACRKIGPEEFNLLIPLMKDCFGMDVNIEYFIWKYIKNPAGEFIGFIAESDDGEVAAYYGVIPQLYMIQGKERIIYQSCDTMTHSRHRRQGLFQKLALLCYDYLNLTGNLFVIGFGGRQSTPGLSKFGWIKLFDTRNYFFSTHFTRFLFYNYKTPKDIVSLRIDELESIEDLILKSNAGSAIYALKKINNYKWRVSNPLHEYKFTGIDKNGIVNSFICYYESENKIVIFDHFFYQIKDGKILTDYLKVESVKNKKAGLIIFCQEQGLVAAEFRKYNFISNPFNVGPLSQKPPFMIYSDKDTMKLLGNRAYWNISSYDHDSI